MNDGGKAISIKDRVAVMDYKYFYAYLYADTNSIFMVTFNSGHGNVYAKFSNYFDTLRNVNSTLLPTVESHDLEGTYDYRGTQIKIGAEEMKKNKNCIDKSGQLSYCQIVFGVYGNNLNYNDNDVEFSVHYYDADAKKQIYQNNPHKSNITKGDYKYYNFYLDDNVNNLYISLSNMNGDADLLLSRGNNLPTMLKSDWSSKTTQNELLNINIDDEIFKVNNIKSMTGNYTIGVYAYSNTTFTLFYSTQDQKIIHLDDNSPMSCQAKKDQYCYFKFDNIKGYYQHKDLKMIFSTEYSYGKGEIYSKIYNEDNIKSYKNLPSDTINDHFSQNKKINNLHKVFCNIFF